MKIAALNNIRYNYSNLNNIKNNPSFEATRRMFKLNSEYYADYLQELTEKLDTGDPKALKEAVDKFYTTIKERSANFADTEEDTCLENISAINNLKKHANKRYIEHKVNSEHCEKMKKVLDECSKQSRKDLKESRRFHPYEKSKVYTMSQADYAMRTSQAFAIPSHLSSRLNKNMLDIKVTEKNDGKSITTTYEIVGGNLIPVDSYNPIWIKGMYPKK